MNLPIRPLLVLAILALALAACGTTAGAPAVEDPAPSEPASPIATPTTTPTTPATPAPTPTPEPEPEPTDDGTTTDRGTITVVEGAAVGGPGISVAEAIAAGMTDPVLVRGILIMDGEGTILMCDEFAGGGAPTCGEPALEVIDYPSATDWDMEHADVTGLQEAEGFLFYTDALVYGIVQP